jgi:transposase-like protein
MSTSEERHDLSEINEQDQVILALTPKQQRFVHLYVTGQYQVPELARLLEVHPNTLFNWLRREDVKSSINHIQQVTQDMVSVQLKTLTNKAVQRLHRLMDSPIDGVALQAVKDVLDRAGHKSKTEIKVDKTVTTVEQKMKELINSTIIDAEFEEVE